ncbi:hypothetical protein HHA02_10670 [Cobetia marina]|nr:hypothetical protein HHA02_10670 [Cobetia marina]
MRVVRQAQVVELLAAGGIVKAQGVRAFLVEQQNISGHDISPISEGLVIRAWLSGSGYQALVIKGLCPRWSDR